MFYIVFFKRKNGLIEEEPWADIVSESKNKIEVN